MEKTGVQIATAYVNARWVWLPTSGTQEVGPGDAWRKIASKTNCVSELGVQGRDSALMYNKVGVVK